MASVRADPAQMEAAFGSLLDEWHDLVAERDPVPTWQTTFHALESKEHDLRTAGLWRTGGRTLLRALGVHHDEVLMCRGLAWLLTPDGWHGLGTRVLSGLLARLGLPEDGAGRASVVTEEVRGDTRADIVVRFPTTTLLIEAKIFAGEQARQADRLAALWAEESPTLIFLTRNGRAPTTALDSIGEWRRLSWLDLVPIVTAAIGQVPDCLPGVRELLQTLERYGG